MSHWKVEEPNGEWTVIDHQDNSPVRQAPSLGLWNGRKFFWGGSFSHWDFKELPPVLKVYRVEDALAAGIEFDGLDAIDIRTRLGDWVEVQFCKDFPILPHLLPGQPLVDLPWYLRERCTGWISPEGAVFFCRYGEHDSVGWHLCRQLYGERERWLGIKRMRDENWASFQDGYLSLAKMVDLTYDQFLAVLEMLKYPFEPQHLHDLGRTLGYVGFPIQDAARENDLSERLLVEPPGLSRRSRGS